jgi:DNA adenine methylase
MAKKPAPIEVINDADSEIVNLFQQLRRHPRKLVGLVQATPYSRQEFEQAFEKASRTSAIERARRFLVASMMTVNGAIGSNGTGTRHSGFSYSQSYARNGQEARVSRWNSLPKRLRDVLERLKQVRVENQDARDLFKKFLNRPATLVYLDPPYLMSRDTKYKIDANDEEFHKELLMLCCQAKCMVLLSGYDNSLYRSYLNKRNGWERETIDTHTRDTNGTNLKRIEVLWKNKHFVKASQTGRVPIRLTRKEKAYNKLNPLRQ